MTWFWVAFVLVIVAGLVVFKLLGGSLSEPKDFSQLVLRLRPVNPRSLAQLTSREDDELLRRSLSKRQYRLLRKQRLLVLRRYCGAALGNCEVLQSCGQVLQRDADPDTRQLGRHLASACLRLRAQLLQTILFAHLGVWIPILNTDPAVVSHGYATLAQSLTSLSESKSATIRKALEQAFQ